MEDCSAMEDRSAAYNNAGVSILMLENGNQGVAMELFRGALESKLAFERSLLVCQDPQGDSLGHLAAPATNCVAQAEAHLQNIDLYLSSEPSSAATTVAPSSTPEYSDVVQTVINVPRQMRGYDPFISKNPMIIDDSPNVTQLTSSKIVFNLGLVHQVVNRESPAVAVFYEISISLMPHAASMAPESLLFHLVLLNNFGVWCFENGDGECMGICVEQLTICLEELDRLNVVVDAPTRLGIETNIQWLLTPLNGGSPAA